jgi:hypothetical protein
MVDPDPRVSGAGLEMLRSQGVEVVLLENTSIGTLCKEANCGFIFRVLHRRPYSIVCALLSPSAPSQLSNPADDEERLLSRFFAGGYAALDEVARDADCVLLTDKQLLCLLRGMDGELPFPPRMTIAVASTADADEGLAAKVLETARDDRFRRPWFISDLSLFLV